MQSKQLRIVAPFHAFTGYSKMARYALRCALDAGYEVEIHESDQRDFVVQYVGGRRSVEKQMPKPKWPFPDDVQSEIDTALKTRVAATAPTIMIQLMSNLNAWAKFQSGPTIGWTMTESDNVHPFWRHCSRSTDVLWAPSRYVFDTFTERIPEVQTRLMPIPIDHRVFEACEFADEVKQRPPFLFLSVFHVSKRKRWDDMCVAFAEEFCTEGKQVGMLLKPSNLGPVSQMADWCRDMGAWMRVDTGERNDYMLSALYRTAQCYVVPASEGFGMTYLEAGAAGVPSIALNRSGAVDFVNEENGWRVPSFMEPLPGHMPQCYPRKSHNFASFTIDDLRATMRQAYTDHQNGIRKGAAALKTSKQYSCKALAPKFDEEVQEATEIWKSNRRTLIPVAKPEWATVAGNWGDVMCCMGNVNQFRMSNGINEVGILYYGRDAAISQWLEAQDGVREVRSVVHADKDQMERNYALISQSKAHHGPDRFRAVFEEAGLEFPKNVAYTHLCLSEPRRCNYWQNPKLSPQATDWADMQELPSPFIVLNPVSIASNKWEDHWPFWREAMLWCVQNLNCHIVITGQNDIPYPPFDNVTNLSGKTRTMQDLLALAHRSDGIISTSNNLGIYSPIAGIPSVIVCAATCRKETFYFKWQTHQTVSQIPFEDSMTEFIQAVTERFPEFLAERPNVLDPDRELMCDTVPLTKEEQDAKATATA